METNSLLENRTSILIDARKVESTYWDTLLQLLSKSKLDIEILCLVASQPTENALKDWVEKGKMFMVLELCDGSL